jgi:hypothetical protein
MVLLQAANVVTRADGRQTVKRAVWRTVGHAHGPVRYLTVTVHVATDTITIDLDSSDIDRGGQRAADAGFARSGARMIALAERFGLQYGFWSTMSAARVRRAAQDADGPAYAEAVSSYAGLDPEGLRASARAALRERARVSG